MGQEVQLFDDETVDQISAGSAPPEYTDYPFGIFSQIGRKFLKGASTEWSEQLYDTPDPDVGLVGELAESAGAMAPWMAGGLGVRAGVSAVPKLAKLAELFPRLYAVAETGFLGANIEGSREKARGGEYLDGAWQGFTDAAGPEALFRGVGGAKNWLKETVLSPKKTFTANRLRSVGLVKQDLDDQLMKWAEKYDAVVPPGAVTPGNPVTDMIEQRGARTVTARPAMQEVADDLSTRVLPAFQKDVLTEVGGQAGHLIDNIDVGKTLQRNFKRKVDDIHTRASAMYDDLMETQLGDHPVEPENLIQNLEELLTREGYDPKATGDFPGVNSIYGLMRDLKKLKMESPLILGPDGNPIPLPSAYNPTSFKWLHNRSVSLRPPKGVQDPSSYIKNEARDLILDQLSNSAEKINPQAATALKEARKQWAIFRSLEKDDLGKKLLSGNPEPLINQIFTSIPNIEKAREFLGPEVYNVARQRHLANILWRGKAVDTGGKIGAGLVPTSLDASALNRAVKAAGGVDGERFKTMFADEPDKLQAFHQLMEILNKLDPSRRIYAGRAEVPGGPETKGLANILETLFSTTSILPHLYLGKQLGETLAKKPAFNRLLGGQTVIPPGSLMRTGVQTETTRRITGHE